MLNFENGNFQLVQSKVEAKDQNRYNQVLQQENTTHTRTKWSALSQQVTTRLQGKDKTVRQRQTRKTNNIKDPQKKYRLGTVSIIALKASGRDCTNNNELLHKIGVLQRYAMQLFVFTSEFYKRFDGAVSITVVLKESELIV